jgi:hypothetical protein
MSNSYTCSHCGAPAPELFAEIQKLHNLTEQLNKESAHPQANNPYHRLFMVQVEYETDSGFQMIIFRQEGINAQNFPKYKIELPHHMQMDRRAIILQFSPQFPPSSGPHLHLRA